MPFVDIGQKVRYSPEKLSKVALCESPRLLFDVYCLEPGQAQKLHAHDGLDKVYVVQSGRPTVLLGSEERALDPGQAAYAPAGEPHGVRNDTQERATLLVFQARGPGIVKTGPEKG